MAKIYYLSYPDYFDEILGSLFVWNLYYFCPNTPDISLNTYTCESICFELCPPLNYINKGIISYQNMVNNKKENFKYYGFELKIDVLEMLDRDQTTIDNSRGEQGRSDE